MRALCGSIIAAGALIGLGLTALAFGIRFQAIPERHADGTFQGIYLGVPSLMFTLVILAAAMLIGLGITFFGLAYHHERRYREALHSDRESPRQRITT
jgi:hypothetical protein